MGRNRTPEPVKRAVQRAFQTLLKGNPSLTQAAIAQVLGVSRQTVNQYLSGRTVPSMRTLALAVRQWDLEIGIEGHKFTSADFPAAKLKTEAHQIELPLDELRASPKEITIPGTNVALKIRAKPDGAFEIVFNVELAS